MAEPGSIRCRLLRTAAELESIAPAWESLWLADRGATPFQHPAWLIPWWRHFGEQHVGRELRCVLVCEGVSGAPLAFLPFYLYPHPETGERQLLLLGAGTSDYLDGVFGPGDLQEHIEHAAVALHFLLSDAAWDVLHATQLRSTSPLLKACEQLASAQSTPNDATNPEASAAFLARWTAEPTSSLAASPFAELPTKIRRNAMYYRNRAGRAGALRLEQASEETCGAVFEQLVALHTARWQAAGEHGVLADPAVLAHHREAVPALARAGLLRLMVLRLGEDTLGILYSFIDAPHRTQYFYLPAFSPEYAALRPGTLLTAFAIDHAAAEGVTRIDFLRGEEGYKQLWHAEQVSTLGVALCNPRASRSSTAASKAGIVTGVNAGGALHVP